jgi:hypothetical protein
MRLKKLPLPQMDGERPPKTTDEAQSTTEAEEQTLRTLLEETAKCQSLLKDLQTKGMRYGVWLVFVVPPMKCLFILLTNCCQYNK